MFRCLRHRQRLCQAFGLKSKQRNIEKPPTSLRDSKTLEPYFEAALFWARCVFGRYSDLAASRLESVVALQVDTQDIAAGL